MNSNIQKDDVLSLIESQGFIPLFFHDNTEDNKQIAQACFDGGSRLIEFTNRGEGALYYFKELLSACRKISPKFVIGVGSITDPYTASAFVNVGADFIVGPSFCEDTAKYCNNSKILYVPGCATLNEILRAEKLGLDLIKIFPASSVGGVDFIKAVLGPCPWLKLMPTGGVSADSDELKRWFDAGVTAVGLGSNIISRQRIEAGDYKGIAKALNGVAVAIRNARS